MSTPTETIQEEIKYLRARLLATDDELANIVALRNSLRHRLLCAVQKLQEAKLAEDKQAQAQAVAE